MATPTARLAFFKLNVADLAEARAFWQRAFGFERVGGYDLPEFAEDIMAIPDEDGAPQLMLVQSKPAGDVSVGPGHGPLGLVCPDIEASYAHALNEGASTLMPPTDVGGVMVAMLASPQGHQIELVQVL
ncbi:VOC family protein [Aurantiacibacter flavus]|uniref:VOC family protein n=1 Tax=Aurantiacibacter flavus TaxID=3145232 RepID=A0ABV0CSJ5_9SPHN